MSYREIMMMPSTILKRHARIIQEETGLNYTQSLELARKIAGVEDTAVPERVSSGTFAHSERLVMPKSGYLLGTYYDGEETRDLYLNFGDTDEFPFYLAVGNPGAGKTVQQLAVLHDALERGRKVVWVQNSGGIYDVGFDVVEVAEGEANTSDFVERVRELLEHSDRVQILTERWSDAHAETVKAVMPLVRPGTTFAFDCAEQIDYLAPEIVEVFREARSLDIHIFGETQLAETALRVPPGTHFGIMRITAPFGNVAKQLLGPLAGMLKDLVRGFGVREMLFVHPRHGVVHANMCEEQELASLTQLSR